MNAIQQAIYKQGYFVEKGLLTEEVMTALKSELGRFKKMDRDPSLKESSFLQSVVFHQSISKVLHSILGKKLIYTQDYSLNALNFWSTFGWHKDCLDRHNEQGEDWRTKHYPIVRVGIYLGDYSNKTGSLGLQPYSHRGTQYANPGINVKTKPGDVIFWLLTTTHSANSPSFKWMPSKAIAPLFNNRPWLALCNKLGKLVNCLPTLLQQPLDDRQVVFFTVGSPDDRLAAYLSYLLHRKYFSSSILESKATEDFPLPPESQYLNLQPFISDINPEFERANFDPAIAPCAGNELKEKIRNKFI